MTDDNIKPNKNQARANDTKKIPVIFYRLSKSLKNDGYKFYPVLFTLFPLLSFYGANQSQLSSGDFSLTTFILFNLAIVVVVWPLAWLAIRSVKKASILTVVILAVFFNFGRVHDQLQTFVINTPITPLGPTKILLIASVLLIAGAWLGIKKLSTKNTDTSNLVLTVVGLYLFISTFLSVALPHLSSRESTVKTNESSLTADIERTPPQELPDIYYIILDAYPRADILEKRFDFDNSQFVNELKNRGFFIADKANANYTHTHWSVPSTFNMDYLNYLSGEVGEESNDREPLKNLFHNNSVVRKFKSFGYKYVQIGSQWDWARSSPLADLEVRSDREEDSKILNIQLDEFTLVYLQTTALKPWISSQARGTLLSRVLGSFERTEKVSEIDDPTLSISHISTPHPPYLFNSDGVIPGLSDKLALDNNSFSDRKAFVEQTIYTNKLTLKMLDSILENSETPPIIILAADHGPASSLNSQDFRQTDLGKMNVEGIRERTAILNSYYFPDQEYNQLYAEISPVNSFRVILNQYFNQQLELLPDQTFLSDNGDNQYRLTDITSLVKY